MREVLFRGKAKAIAGCPYNNGKPDGEWVFGYVFSDLGAMKIRQYETDRPECNDYEVDPETVGQYTGLTDKNGKRIFEGDIVERVSDGERAVISWLKYFACFGLSFDGWCCGFDNYDYNLPSDFEVIGNIHDNPEILKTPSL